MRKLFASLIAFCLCDAPVAAGPVQTFRNDYQGFVSAAGPLSTIDFETLPDGTPSVGGRSITSAFNYDAFGAHFSAPVHTPYIAGNAVTGFGLRVNELVQHTWLIADLTQAVRSVGIYYPSDTSLCAFDSLGGQIGCASYIGPGPGIYFLGIVSGTPISRVTVDRGSSTEDIESFMFSPVPEPATAIFLGSGGLLVLRRRHR